MVSGKTPGLLCVMLLIVSVAVPLLVIVTAWIELDAPTLVFGNVVLPVMLVWANIDVGVTLLDAADDGPVPTPLVAVTVNETRQVVILTPI